MAKRKKGFALERHRELGEELYRINRSLGRLSCEISKSYPVNGKLYRISRVLDRNMRKLRSELDNVLAREQPQLTDSEFVRIYYCSEAVEAKDCDRNCED